MEKEIQEQSQLLQASPDRGKHCLCYLSVVTTGELHRGVGMIRYRGDTKQADHLSDCLNTIVKTIRIEFFPLIMIGAN